MNLQEREPACAEIAPLLVFYVCDEVNEQERAAIEKHLTTCADCHAQVADEREFHAAFASLPRPGEGDPNGILLSQCRSELAEALDDLQKPPVKQRVSAFSFLTHWMALHPAWSAATLILLGLVAGAESTRWLTGQNNAAARDQAVNIRPSPQLTEDQLSKMVVAGVDVTPSPEPGSKNVRVLLNAEQPMELTGNVDDSDVRNVLTYVVKNGDRFDSGVRLDCLDALRTHAENSQVRSALLCAARKDQNPAVRLKALEALRASVSENEVREALLESLKHDSNPGVRVEAVNLLVRSLEAAQSEVSQMPVVLPEMPNGEIVQAGRAATVRSGSLENMLRVLEDLQRNDPNRYVRLRSAAALHEISTREPQ